VVEGGSGVELHGSVRVRAGDVAARESLQPLPFGNTTSAAINNSIIVICNAN
jgi:hypothetical protein